MGTAVGGVGLYAKSRAPAPVIKPPAPEVETEQEPTAPPVDKRQALKDALAKRRKPAEEVQPAPTTVPSEPAPTEVAEEVQPAPSPEFESLVEKYKKRGYMAEDAATLARNEIEEATANAPTEEGAKDVTEPVVEASRESAEVPAQPADNVPATTGVGEAERDGVVPARPDVAEPVEGKGTEPTAVTAEEEKPKDRLVTFDNGKPWTYFYPGAKVVQSAFAGAPAKVIGVEEKRGQPTFYKLEVDVS